MNPELERLLAALAARDNASPVQFAEADAEVERLLDRGFQAIGLAAGLPSQRSPEIVIAEPG